MSAANQKITAQTWLILICGGVGASLALAIVVGVACLGLSSGDPKSAATATTAAPPAPIIVAPPPVKNSSSSDDKQTRPSPPSPPAVLPPTPPPAPPPHLPPTPQPPTPQPPPATPTSLEDRSNWATYKNERLSQTHFKTLFIGFSFKYPADRFVFDSGHQCFCKLDRNYFTTSGGKMTLETITFLPLTADDTKLCRKDPKVGYPKALHRLGNAMAQVIPGYQEIGMRNGTLGGINSRELLFKAYVTNTAQGSVWYFGRLIAAVKGDRGVGLILSASSTVPEIRSAEDVGIKADMGGILETFQFAQ